ncbi:MAG: DUF4360 domain-containing protein [Bdellovibrionota bacterium]
MTHIPGKKSVLLLSLLMVTVAHAAPSTKEIRFQWNGSGCAESESKSPWDPMVVTLVASKDPLEFQVRQDPWASPRDARKNCSLVVSSSEPLQFALESIDIKGSGALAADAKVDITVEASSQGAPGSKRYDLQRTSRDKVFKITKSLDDGELFWSACGRALQVNAKSAVKSGAMVDTRIDHLAYNLQAKSCKK